MTGKFVVNRAMSLDGFMASPDDSSTPSGTVTALRYLVVESCAS